MMLETALAFEHLIKNPKIGTARKKSRSGDKVYTCTCRTIVLINKTLKMLQFEAFPNENMHITRKHACDSGTEAIHVL